MDLHILDNFVSEDDCNSSINLIDRLVEEYKTNNVEISNDDPNRYVFVNPIDDVSINFVKDYHEKLLQFDWFPKEIVHEVIFVKYDPGSSLGLHNDFINQDGCTECTHACAFYLNDNYSGGEICFPNFDLEIKSKTGSAVIFSQLSEDYDHSVNVVNSGSKYMINFCTTLNPEKNIFNVMKKLDN